MRLRVDPPTLPTLSSHTLTHTATVGNFQSDMSYTGHSSHSEKEQMQLSNQSEISPEIHADLLHHPVPFPPEMESFESISAQIPSHFIADKSPVIPLHELDPLTLDLVLFVFPYLVLGVRFYVYVYVRV